MSDLLGPHGLYRPWNSLSQDTGVGSLSLLQGIFPTQGLNPGHPHSLPAEPQGKPENTGVGSLSLLQQIFSTQESNWGLLHCRQILYQLSYLGSLFWVGWEANVLLWQWPAQLWKQGVYLHTLTLPMGGITGWFLVTVLVRWCVLSLSCAILGEGVNTGQVKLSLSSSPGCRVLDFVCLFVCLFVSAFAPAVCWNFSAGISGFCNALLVHRWLSTLIFFEGKAVENLHFAMLMISLSSFNLHNNTVK